MIGNGIAVLHRRLLGLLPGGELYLVEALIASVIAARVLDETAGAFRLGESALIGAYCVVQVMGMQTRQDLPRFNLVTDVDQYLSDYARENDADMIGLLFVNSQTTDCRGC